MMKKYSIILFLLMCVTLPVSADIWVEAESFQNKGGWVIDHQAFNKIGSAYLMAHGMGEPVKDAYTYVTTDQPGYYHVYVNTYNWTSPWYGGEGPGAFNVFVNDMPVQKKLGVEGDRWGWQYAGKVRLDRNNKIALHDLTGFNGRVDAIVFTKAKRTLPSELNALNALRNKNLGFKEPQKEEKVDLVVIGGGVAGCCTALSAARYGLKVALVDNLPRVGGNNYLGVHVCGVMCYNLYPSLGRVVRELCGLPDSGHQLYGMEYIGNGNGYLYMNENREEIADLRERLLREENVRLYQNINVFAVGKNGQNISYVVGKDLRTNREYLFSGDYFVDSTGDGVVGYLAGADYHIGREPYSYAKEPSAPQLADQKKLGATLNWSSVEGEQETFFPSLKDMPWAMQCSDQYHLNETEYNWRWETGFEIDNALEPELVRDNMLRAIYGNWAYLKNNVATFKKRSLDKVSFIAQKRESRRLMGAMVLNENDIRGAVEYPDASFTTTWTLDIHFAQPDNSKAFPGWEWQSYCHNDKKETWIRPYHVPYRVLYSKDFNNLFIGGRNMSVTHVALGTVRVQATLGMAGEVIGMAAGICRDHKAMPADVYTTYLDELKRRMTDGVPTHNR